jgi:hypothetical protein
VAVQSLHWRGFGQDSRTRSHFAALHVSASRGDVTDQRTLIFLIDVLRREALGEYRST